MSNSGQEYALEKATTAAQPFSLPLYLLIVCILSWPFQIISAMGPSTLSRAVIFNSASMVAVGVATFVCAKYAFRDGFGGAGWRWGKGRCWLVAIAIPAALWVVPALIDLALGDLRMPETFSWAKVAWILELLFVVLIPAFGEEIGWRGYMLPRMASCRSARKAVIWHALIWYAWHFPLVATAAFAAMKHEMTGASPLAVVSATAAALAAGSILGVFDGVIFAWIWSWSGSIVIVTVLHAASDGFRDSLSITVGSGSVGAIWTPVLTILLGLLLLWKYDWTALERKAQR